MGIPSASGPVVDTLLDAVARHGTVVWFAGSGADETLARELGLRLAREPALAELELMYGSWDPAGARLLDAVAVMDQLVSPGGDPWKRQQTHQTLGRYLLEEAYETYDAIEAHDLAALREELGDVLLQVVLHARMAEEADEPWSIDDVAGGLVEKLVRRNPHVFGSADITDVDEIVDNWERIKREERAARGPDASEAGGSVLDGVARAQPALSLAAKIVSRARRAGIDVPVPGSTGAHRRPPMRRHSAPRCSPSSRRRRSVGSTPRPPCAGRHSPMPRRYGQPKAGELRRGDVWTEERTVTLRRRRRGSGLRSDSDERSVDQAPLRWRACPPRDPISSHSPSASSTNCSRPIPAWPTTPATIGSTIAYRTSPRRRWPLG